MSHHSVKNNTKKMVIHTCYQLTYVHTCMHSILSSTQSLTQDDTHSARSPLAKFIVLQASSHVYLYYMKQNSTNILIRQHTYTSEVTYVRAYSVKVDQHLTILTYTNLILGKLH